MKLAALLFMMVGALVAQTPNQERIQLRERLRQQFSAILETRETERGLIVSVNDDLFDVNKRTLKPGAREKLARIAGILLAHPGLRVQLEGVGSLSEQRAHTVRDYLLSQGIPATNMTAAGRQPNRQVEMVVSGEPIGVGGRR